MNRLRYIFALLAFVAMPASSVTSLFSDDFDGKVGNVDSDAEWTKEGGAGGTQLVFASDIVQTLGTQGARRSYRVVPDLNVTDMYVTAVVPELTNRDTDTDLQIALRYQDNNNYIGIGVSEGNNAACGIRIAGTWTAWDNINDPDTTDIIALRLEAEGEEIRCYYDNGSGDTLFHTESSVSQLAAQTDAAMVGNTNISGVAAWDDFDTGSLADEPAQPCASTECTEDIFDVDPFASGTTYYFDPTATGSNNGLTPANAFEQIGQVNSAGIPDGSQLLFREGTETIANTRLLLNSWGQGTGTDPFFIGSYYLDGNGDPVVGLSGTNSNTPGGRPCIDGMDFDNYDYYGGMSQAQLTAMQPSPLQSGGIFQEGTSNGLVHITGTSDYTLNIWIENLCVRASGGKGISLIQSPGAHATGGALLRNLYLDGAMKQSIHIGGVYEVIVEDSWLTRADNEQIYQSVVGNLQGQLTTKGNQGDPDTPAKVTFRRNVLWDSHSSECMNSNSGNKDVIIEDNVCIDTGKVYALYWDRTFGGAMRRNIVIRTGREQWHDFEGALVDGRGGHCIGIQNEKSVGSFPWDEYNTAADFALYQSQQVAIEYNIAVGCKNNYFILSQASVAADVQPEHYGEAMCAGCYFYGNLSLDPADHHFSIASPSPNTQYVLRTDYPLRIWGNAFWNGTTQSGDNDLVERNDAQFNTVWSDNCVSSDITSPSNFDTNEVQDCLTMPLDDYWDLSQYMEYDINEHMSYTQVREFLVWLGINPDNLAERDLVRFKPTSNTASGVASSTLTYPPLSTYALHEGLDIEGQAVPADVYYGPFATVQEAVDITDILPLLLRRRNQMNGVVLH